MEDRGRKRGRNLVPSPDMSRQTRQRRPSSAERYERSESSRYAHGVYSLLGYHKPELPSDSMFEIMRQLVPESHARMIHHIRMGKTYEEAKQYELNRRR